MLIRHTVASPLGPLTLTEQGGALVALDWGRSDAADAPSPLLREAEMQLGAYFAGQLKRFDLPLAPEGTDFHKSVWDALLAIPYGETFTYGELARGLRSFARAVGIGCGANPIPIIIPCHRVVGVNSLGGYSGQGGLATKRRLLALEEANTQVKRQPSLFDPPLTFGDRPAVPLI